MTLRRWRDFHDCVERRGFTRNAFDRRFIERGPMTFRRI